MDARSSNRTLPSRRRRSGFSTRRMKLNRPMDHKIATREEAGHSSELTELLEMNQMRKVFSRYRRPWGSFITGSWRSLICCEREPDQEERMRGAAFSIIARN